nr:hypothetical protein [Tanacetum cinerariifolium]
VLRLTSFFKAFLVTADVPDIYMQEFWATSTVHYHSIRFKMDNKKHIVNLEYFREMLHICPRLHSHTFDELPIEEEILAFLRFLRHGGKIRRLTDVNINKLHQPWRLFAAIIMIASMDSCWTCGNPFHSYENYPEEIASRKERVPKTYDYRSQYDAYEYDTYHANYNIEMEDDTVYRDFDDEDEDEGEEKNEEFTLHSTNTIEWSAFGSFKDKEDADDHNNSFRDIISPIIEHDKESVPFEVGEEIMEANTTPYLPTLEEPILLAFDDIRSKEDEEIFALSLYKDQCSNLLDEAEVTHIQNPPQLPRIMSMIESNKEENQRYEASFVAHDASFIALATHVDRLLEQLNRDKTYESQGITMLDLMMKMKMKMKVKSKMKNSHFTRQTLWNGRRLALVRIKKMQMITTTHLEISFHQSQNMMKNRFLLKLGRKL